MLLHVLTTLPPILARGGGGGSGGGGGGGGGGGIILLLGYLPTHFVGAFLRRKLKNPIGLSIMIAVTLVYGILWMFLGSIGFLFSIAAFIGGPAGYFGWFGKIPWRRRRLAQQEISQAAQQDPAWDLQSLNQRVHDVFMRFQQDWSTFNLQGITSYTSPTYAQHVALMLAAIKQRQRRNAVDNPQLLEWFPVDVADLSGNNSDQVTYLIHGRADDKLIETIEGQEQQLFEDKKDFFEYWRFVRSGNSWVLDSISQQTLNMSMMRSNIIAFAAMQGMFYSPDWGWLLLPRRGVLFKHGKLGTSDINNHVIGFYHKLIIELYTYIPNPRSNSSDIEQYVIAQVALPKRYDSLIVEAKGPMSWLGGLLHHAPKGYNRISLEWPDFNKRYTVYATDVEQVTAFELLHPAYMEKLFALPFKVSIEVVDNVVYLYTKDKKADYQTMYSILQDAFKEMRL